MIPGDRFEDRMSGLTTRMGSDSKPPRTRPPAGDAARRLRWISLAALFGGAVVATLALGYQFLSWGDSGREAVLDTLELLPIFWSPYVALAALVLALGRHALRAVILLTGSVMVAGWGIYWHLDVLWLRPSVMSQVFAPVLIAGNQWLVVLVSGGLALLAGVARRPPVRSDTQS